MNQSETILWSAVLGSMGLMVLLALADVIYSRSRTSLQSLGFLALSWLFALLMCGLLAEQLLGPYRNWLQAAQVLIGPLVAGLGCYWVSLWLVARKRDRLMQYGLRAASALCFVVGPACLLLPLNMQLQTVATLPVLAMAVSLWLSVRAAHLGDRMAWGLAVGCLLALPFQVGMYALALGNPLSLLLQMLVALTGLVSYAVLALMMWWRNHRQISAQREVPSEIDPVTRLFGSMALMRKILAAQRRQARTGSDGMVLAVLVFEPEKLAAQVGIYGLNEVYAELARRTQRQAGVLNPVGRYYDRCFIALVETLHSPRLMRTTGLRLASRLRRPIEVATMSGERISLTVEIGIGVVHFSRASKDLDQLLHDAQHLAELARQMRSRAAAFDPLTGTAMAVEKIALDGTWHGFKQVVQYKPTDSALVGL